MNTSAAQTGLTIILGVAAVALPIFAIVAIIKAFTRKTGGWITAAILTTVITLGMLGLLGILAAKKFGNVFTDGGHLERTLTSKDGEYTLTVPNAWLPMPQLNAEAGIVAGNVFNSQFALILTEKKEDLGFELATFAKVTTEEMGKAMQNAQLGEITAVRVHGYPALRRRVSGRSEGLDLVYHHTSVDTGDALTQIMCWTELRREKDAFAIFDKIAETFTALKAAPVKTRVFAVASPERIRQIIAEQFGVGETEVTLTAHFKNDLGADDLDIVEMLMAVEEEFDISIADDVTDQFHKVEDLILYVEKNLPPASKPL